MIVNGTGAGEWVGKRSSAEASGERESVPEFTGVPLYLYGFMALYKFDFNFNVSLTATAAPSGEQRLATDRQRHTWTSWTLISLFPRYRTMYNVGLLM